MLDDFLNPKKRQAASSSDMLQIYRARIYSKPDPGDDRLQVRIMPQMGDITNTKALPYYPPFFRGQVIVGVSESEDKENAEYVWVAALPDFTVGYVMGLANTYETLNTSKYTNSYNFKNVIEGLIQRGVANSSTSYKDIYVQFWNDAYMEAVNKKTGDKYMFQSNGTMIAMTLNQIYLRVGAAADFSTPANSIADSKAGQFSVIRLSRDDVTITTDKFSVNANTISLGNSGLYLTGMSGIVPVQASGTTLHPQTHIRL